VRKRKVIPVGSAHGRRTPKGKITNELPGAATGKKERVIMLTKRDGRTNKNGTVSYDGLAKQGLAMPLLAMFCMIRRPALRQE
jgi:hypothetical protein